MTPGEAFRVAVPRCFQKLVFNGKVVLMYVKYSRSRKKEKSIEEYKPATAYSNGAESVGKSVHWPCIQHQVSLVAVSNITITVNKGRQAGPMSCLFLKMSMVWMIGDTRVM